MMPAEAVPARVAGYVVGCNNPVSLLVAINPLTHFNDFSGNFVPKDQGCTLDAIPLHHIAAADATGLYAHKQFPGAYPGSGHLLYPDVLVVVIHSHAHVSYPLVEAL